MKYAKYEYGDTVNGSGCRVSLYPSGCTMGCPGCFNKVAQDFDYGTEYTTDFEDKILMDISGKFISGLSIIGGHGLEKQNFDTVLNLCKRVKSECPTKDIYLWTGFTLAQVQSHKIFHQILPYIDVLIDGKYIEELRDTTLYLRGSSNQQVRLKGVDF